MSFAIRSVPLALALLAAVPAAAAAAPAYRVDARTGADRNAVAATGAAIVEVDHGQVVVTATAREVRTLRRRGFRVTRGARFKPPRRGPVARASDFPAADSGYHNLVETNNRIDAAITASPGLVRRVAVGSSYLDTPLPAVKISDNVATDEDEPEVLFTSNQHAREHLTNEQALYLLDQLRTSTSTRVRNLVDSREIYIVFMVNPDGVEYDIATGAYRSWRKNRQPNAGSSAVGTDLNRNWSWQWGCCGGSSGTFSSDTYRGAAPFSAPETQRIRDFVLSRRIGGVQQIRAGIDFHSYSELVLWPYGYTNADTAPGLDARDQQALSQLGRNMAASNGYTPEQASDLYIADGTISDWMWGDQRIAHYTYELYPRTSNPGFYPPDEVIARETSRNLDAVLQLLEAADCLYEVIGESCTPRVTTYSDDFEAARGWTRNAAGTDTATLGLFERGDPQATTSSGAKQLGTTTSGVNALVTGPLAGTSAGAYDVDGGVTTIQSPSIAVPTADPRLELRYTFAHGSNSSTADFFRVRVNGTQVLSVAGAAANRNGAWQTASIPLAQWAGQNVRVEVQTADASTASLVEAAVDDVKVTRAG